MVLEHSQSGDEAQLPLMTPALPCFSLYVSACDAHINTSDLRPEVMEQTNSGCAVMPDDYWDGWDLMGPAPCWAHNTLLSGTSLFSLGSNWSWT